MSRRRVWSRLSGAVGPPPNPQEGRALSAAPVSTPPATPGREDLGPQQPSSSLQGQKSHSAWKEALQGSQKRKGGDNCCNKCAICTF